MTEGERFELPPSRFYAKFLTIKAIFLHHDMFKRGFNGKNGSTFTLCEMDVIFGRNYNLFVFKKKG